MKKLLVFFGLCVILVVLTCGCGAKGKQSQSQTNNSETKKVVLNPLDNSCIAKIFSSDYSAAIVLQNGTKIFMKSVKYNWNLGVGKDVDLLTYHEGVYVVEADQIRETTNLELLTLLDSFDKNLIVVNIHDNGVSYLTSFNDVYYWVMIYLYDSYQFGYELKQINGESISNEILNPGLTTVTLPISSPSPTKIENESVSTDTPLISEQVSTSPVKKNIVGKVFFSENKKGELALQSHNKYLLSYNDDKVSFKVNDRSVQTLEEGLYLFKNDGFGQIGTFEFEEYTNTFNRELLIVEVVDKNIIKVLTNDGNNYYWVETAFWFSSNPDVRVMDKEGGELLFFSVTGGEKELEIQ